jgi:small subunit ribosomal protein S13
MKLSKNFKNKNYGLGLSRKNILFSKFGLRIKTYTLFSSKLKLVEENLDTFLKINLLKKEYLSKKENYNKNKKIENGSYQGYKFFRGLPVSNQRTKTNSRTARKKN